jgi:hypothetical protein
VFFRKPVSGKSSVGRMKDKELADKDGKLLGAPLFVSKALVTAERVLFLLGARI